MNKSQAIDELQRQIDAIAAVKGVGRRSPAFTGWHRETAVVIGHVFGAEHENVEHFNSISYYPMVAGSRSDPRLFDQRFLEGMDNAEAVIKSMISEVRRFWPIDTDTASSVEGPTIRDRADIILVCALHSPELDKVFRVSNTKWEPLPASQSDPHTYYASTLQTDEGARLQVIAAAPNHMGLAAAGVLATKLVWRFRPKVVVMVGIAAGARRTAQGFGDVIAADQTFDYGAGKLSGADGGVEFVPDPRPHSVGTRAVARLREWERTRRGLDDISNSWPARHPPTQLRLHVGPLGSGAAVVDAKEPLDQILLHWRKMLGLEMEAFAVHSACKEAIVPEPVFLCFKSVCDFAVEKTDGWQDYAAFTAASFAFKFLAAEYAALCT